MTTPPQQPGHILSFDVEEYFQVEAAARSGVTPEQWLEFASRVEASVDIILSQLAEFETRATFFVLGWIAQKHRGLVDRIATAGHEIASHGMSHRMIGRLSPDEFRDELLDSRKLLEDISGKPVEGFRAPTFSITRETAWALDVLAEAGYSYDSSVFPVRHDRYGVPDAPRWTHIARGPGGAEILEIPPLTRRVFGSNLPVGGGGYLRLLPVRLLAGALRGAQAAGQCGMIYLHPWEFDPEQPILPMGRLTRWRHRKNLHKTQAKLRYLLERFSFGPACEFQQALRQGKLETYSYGS